MLFIFFCKPVDVIKEISLRASCFDGGIATSGFLARASAFSSPIIPAWDLVLWKRMGDGDWWIALTMDWRTSPKCGGGGGLGVRAAF